MAKPKSDNKPSKPAYVMSERTRTILLLILLALGIAFIVWTKNQYEANFIETF